MKEIVRINLDNELDLILAHKRTMKLVELCGMSNTIQTTFATAVSEVARCVIGNKSSLLVLGLNPIAGNRKELMAVITSDQEFGSEQREAVKYANRLANEVTTLNKKSKTEIVLTKGINFSGLINDTRIGSFIAYFQKELPLSPYDELRKKNIQLIELSDKLKESEAQYKTLTETLPLMMFTTNTGGNLVYANKWLKEYFGLNETEFGKISWLNLLHVGTNRSVRESWDSAMTSQTKFSAQALLKTKKPDDEPLWHLISLLPVRTEGQLAGWTGFFVDIHAQKLVEETLKNNDELKAAQKQLLFSQVRLEEKITELNKSNHDLEQFAYIASHDLQEPLRKIRTFTELLERHIDDGEKRQKYLDKIDGASDRMTTLIKDVLNYSRLSKSDAGFGDVDLQEVIDTVKLDMELLIEEKGAAISVSDMPVISGIQQQLSQLFYNLISNSLKFTTTEPLITISSRKLSANEVKSVSELHKGSEYVEITLKDNGIGFDQKHASQIFTIFKRLNTKDAYSGTGIGLALCKKIVDNHFGIITATGTLGEGAQFQIVLPID